MLLGGFQHVAEFVELSADGAKDLPYLAGPLFDGQGAEPHLQAVQEGGHGGGAGQVHLVPLLQFLHHAPVHRLRIEPLEGQEEDGEVRGGGRRDILGGHVLGLLLEPGG